MILNAKSDKKGRYYKLGLIDRLALKFENYAGSDFGSRFYEKDFLEGLASRRNEIHRRTTKQFSALVLATTILALFDSLTGTISMAGLTFSVPEFGAIALCVLVSMNLLATVFGLIDQLIIDRLIYYLGSRMGVYSFELLVIDKTAQNLWTSALSPDYFGLKSQGLQSAVQGVALFFYAVFMLAVFGYPVLVF